MRRLFSVAIAVGALLLWMVTPRAAAADWNFETLDGAGGSNGRISASVGYYNAVTLFDGQPHIWYADSTNGNLRHAWWNGTRWSFETLDGAGGPDGRINSKVGYFSAVTIYAGQPHVWYWDYTHADLRHAWWNGTRWSFETLDGVGGRNGRINSEVGAFNAVTIYGGQPHVWYADLTHADLRHAWWTGAQWAFETIDGAGGPNGRVNGNAGASTAVTLYGGQPHLWYRGKGDLRHAWWTGAQWAFETIDGAGGPGGRVNADVGADNAVTLYNGLPHVWYYDVTNGNLRHGWWNGGQWSFEALDGIFGVSGRVNADVGLYNAVTLFNGLPHVWYQNGDSARLRHVWWTGAYWSFEPLDGGGGPSGRVIGDAGSYNTATVYAGQPHLWYLDGTNGNLRHAWWG